MSNSLQQTIPATMEELRCGVQRPSMKTNVLIARTELGKVKKTTFSNSPPDKTFGLHQASDAEGARAVTSSWQAHQPNPDATPGPDFMAMNKAAADSGLVSSNQVRDFRASHPATLRTGVAGVAKPAPHLPSDHNTAFTYGKPSSYRSAEEVRNFGPSEPPVRALVQGAYSHDWQLANLARKDEFDERRKYIKPAATAATQGHALGARLTIAKTGGGSGGASALQHQHQQWKMNKFLKTPPKVTQFMGQGAAAGCDVGSVSGGGDD